MALRSSVPTLPRMRRLEGEARHHGDIVVGPVAIDSCPITDTVSIVASPFHDSSILPPPGSIALKEPLVRETLASA
jgi:hypothetical protein